MAVSPLLDLSEGKDDGEPPRFLSNSGLVLSGRRYWLGPRNSTLRSYLGIGTCTDRAGAYLRVRSAGRAYPLRGWGTVRRQAQIRSASRRYNGMSGTGRELALDTKRGPAARS